MNLRHSLIIFMAFVIMILPALSSAHCCPGWCCQCNALMTIYNASDQRVKQCFVKAKKAFEGKRAQQDYQNYLTKLKHEAKKSHIKDWPDLYDDDHEMTMAYRCDRWEKHHRK